MNQYKYKAFISYRHQPYDIAVATKLHRLIETFHLPKTMKNTSNGTKEKWTVFRDQDELPLSSNLGDDIKVALEQSEFLIVICSERLSESVWCKEEIRYFKELHGGSTKNIIAVLIDGTPDICFPEEILYSEENGEKIPVEPLAANIVAPTQKQSFKLLQTEYLRLIARFLSCGYDELFQREKRRKAKLYSLFGITAASILLLITAISTYSAISISNKNKEILTQNSEFLTMQSQYQWENGEPIEAIKTTLQALPSKENDRPVVVNAEYLLSQQIGAYEFSTFTPIKALEHRSVVSDIYYVGNGDIILTRDNNGIYFRNRENGTLVKEWTMADYLADKVYLHVDTLPYTSVSLKTGMNSGNYPIRLDYSDAITMYEASAKISYGSSLNPNIYIYTDYRIWKVDGRTGEAIWEYEYGGIQFDVIAVQTENGIFIPMLQNSTSRSNYVSSIIVLDEKNGSPIRQIDCSKARLSGLNQIVHIDQNYLCIRKLGMLNPEFLLIENNTLTQDSTPLFVSDDNTSVNYLNVFEDTIFCAGLEYSGDNWETETVTYFFAAYNKNNRKLLWKTDLAEDFAIGRGSYGYGTLLKKENTRNYCDVFLYTLNTRAYLIEASTGNIITKYSFAENITTTHVTQDGYVFLTTDKKNEFVLMARELSVPLEDQPPVCYRINTLITTPDSIARCKEECLTLEKNSTKVYLYRKREKTDSNILFAQQSAFSPNSISTSPSGRYAMIEDRDNDCFVLYDMDSLTPVTTLSNISPDTGIIVSFINDSMFLFRNDSNQAILYDLTNDCIVKTLDRTFLSVSEDGKWLLIDSVAKNGQKKYFAISDLDGNRKDWYLPEDNYTEHIASLSPNGEYVFFVCTLKDAHATVAAYTNMTNSDTITLQTLDPNSVNHITDTYWLTDHSAGILYGKKLFEVYDIEKESMTLSCDLTKLLPAEISKILPINSDIHVAVICNNDRMYKINLKTKTLESEIDLSAFHAGQNLLVSSEDAFYYQISDYYLTSVLVKEDNLLILKTSGISYYIDLASFQLRCKVPYINYYVPASNKIIVYDNDHSTWNIWPYYDTEELINTAHEYLGE